MCFAPQRRALFRHLNFQKGSEPGVCLYILIWKCASRHNGVQFFISHLARWLRTRRFSEPTFSTLRSHKSLEKHNVSWLSYLFAHLHLLSSDSFSSLIFSLLLFSSLWLFPSLLFICPYCRSEVWLLNFLLLSHMDMTKFHTLHRCARNIPQPI